MPTIGTTLAQRKKPSAGAQWSAPTRFIPQLPVGSSGAVSAMPRANQLRDESIVRRVAGWVGPSHHDHTLGDEKKLWHLWRVGSDGGCPPSRAFSCFRLRQCSGWPPTTMGDGRQGLITGWKSGTEKSGAWTTGTRRVWESRVQHEWRCRLESSSRDVGDRARRCFGRPDWHGCVAAV